MKHYLIVQDQYIETLEDRVNKLILEGYEPVGGITISKGEIINSIFQVLYKKDNE